MSEVEELARESEMLIEMPEYSDQESPCCASGLRRPPGSGFHSPWFCMECGAPYDPRAELVARKGCLGCATTLAISDPDLCVHCDVHGIIVVNGRAYQPVH
jgi:hypothetical protein